MKFKTMLFSAAILLGCNQQHEKAKDKDTSTEKNLTTVATSNNANAPFLWENATVYFLLTDRFNNGNPSNDLSVGRKADGAKLRSFMGGDIKGITEKIKEGYFDRLGVNAIWFTPPYEQVHGYTDEGTGKTYAYHGYWPKDWTTIDPNFGTLESLKEMVDEAHKRGIRVLMDVIINHTGPVTDVDNQWPEEWVRTFPQCTYEDYESTVNCTLVKNLPDIKTEANDDVSLPPFLIEKWKEEGRLEEELKSLDDFFVRTGYPRAPRFYIIKWLTDYIRKFGIDGFRADTAKHVEESVWSELYKEALEALKAWKTEHPDKKLDDLDFYMVGEVYGYSIDHGKDFPMGEGVTVDYYEQGFKSLINFAFKADANKTPEALFNGYAQVLNEGALKGYSVLNYISSHDDGQPFDGNRERTLEAGTKLLLAPGAAQIYYGDETGRLLSVNGAEGDAHLRSFMNWEDLKNNKKQNGHTTQEIFDHWSKVGIFRKMHPAVGAGVHEKLNETPYVFKRTLDKAGVKDQVVVVMGESKEAVDVSAVFADGTTLRDYYSGNEAEVKDGKVDFKSDASLQLIGEAL